MDVRQEVVRRLQVVLAAVRQLVDDPETEDPMRHTLMLLMVRLENVLQDILTGNTAFHCMYI